MEPDKRVGKIKLMLLEGGRLAKNLIESGMSETEALALVAQKCAEIFGYKDPNSQQGLTCRAMSPFALAWCESGFSLVEPSPRLAASLMATKVPVDYAEAVARMPWNCFVVEVPEGVIGPKGLIVLNREENRYSWMAILSNGSTSFRHETCLANLLREISELKDQKSNREQTLLGRYFVNVCIECSTISSLTPARVSSYTRAQREGKNPKTNIYKLTRPVSVDVRAAVKDWLGGSGTSPTVQSLVMGHWKRQSCGERSSERKWIHVEAYWRGPEEAPMALREHLLDGGRR